ncbi:hypothetical protein DsansV1_C05g0053981 [Dioscorea sansibarensis]
MMGCWVSRVAEDLRRGRIAKMRSWAACRTSEGSMGAMDLLIRMPRW